MARTGAGAGEPSYNVTELLRRWGDGDPSAGDQLLPLVYEELRRRAGAYLRRERSDHTLQPTALVHEAYLRLVDQKRAVWQNRAQFFAIAAQMMRRVLLDHARAHRAEKRSGQWSRVTLGDAVAAIRASDVDVIDLHDAMERLAALDPRKSRIAELRFFGGLSLEETAEVVGVSLATVERDWQTARAWLFKELSGRAAQ